MKDCTNAKGHEWTDQWWTEVDHGWMNEGWWAHSLVTHFRDQTSQPVRCIYCNEDAFLIKSAV